MLLLRVAMLEGCEEFLLRVGHVLALALLASWSALGVHLASGATGIVELLLTLTLLLRRVVDFVAPHVRHLRLVRLLHLVAVPLLLLLLLLVSALVPPATLTNQSVHHTRHSRR